MIVLAIIGWLLFRPHSAPAPAEAPSPAAQATAPAAAPEPAPTPPAVSTTKPSAAKRSSSAPATAARSAAATASTTAAADVPANGRTVWRVVAYTYRGQTKATDMVAKISDKHSDLDPEVFNPPGRGGVYLVTVGGAMDHDAAVKMLSKGQREGLPADAYVQNFSR